MQSQLLAGPISINDAAFPSTWRSRRNRHHRWRPIAAIHGGKNHYQVLGVTPSATSTEIKRAYRLLALKARGRVWSTRTRSRPRSLARLSRLSWIKLLRFFGARAYPMPNLLRSAIGEEAPDHSAESPPLLTIMLFHPDVSKDSQAEEVFKSIVEAYEVLSNQTTRTEYNHALNAREHEGNFAGAERVNGWGEVRQDMRGRYGGRHNVNRQNSYRHNVNGQSYYRRNVNGQSSYCEDDEADEDTNEADTEETRGSFVEVLKSAFISLFLMKTLGPLVSLVVSFGMALFDQKLDLGYKLGYAIALILGGRSGVLLTMFLSFTSWVCGKTSSSMVALAMIAMWVGLHAARYAPFPQVAFLLLLYMSVKNS